LKITGIIKLQGIITGFMELLRLQKSRNTKHYYQTKKSFNNTKAYIHLTYKERKERYIWVIDS